MERSTSEGAKGADGGAFAVADRRDTAYEGYSCETLQTRLQCLQVRGRPRPSNQHPRIIRVQCLALFFSLVGCN